MQHRRRLQIFQAAKRATFHQNQLEDTKNQPLKHKNYSQTPESARH